jgi:RNA polymerase sigma factor (sigma-70 family)
VEAALGLGEVFADVLAAAQAGAPWAFDRLYRDLAPAVTGYLRLQGAAEPDDVASETFIGVFSSLGAFTGDEDALRSWVFTIAHRRLIDERRKAGRRPALADCEVVEVTGGDVESDAMAALGLDRVRALCQDLPADQRAVLLLRLVGDLTVEQTAQALGKSPGAVKQLQRRGLGTVRHRIEREGVTL